MSKFSSFSSSEHVRGSSSQFSPGLYNKVGGVSGCTGASNVEAAAGNPGYDFVQMGGSPTVPQKYDNGGGYYGVGGVSTSDAKALAGSYAPITLSAGASSGGGRRRRSAGSRRRRSAGSRRRRSAGSRRRRSAGSRRQSKMRGGYSQFLSNVPYSASYSTGGNISASDSALANPAPHNRFINCSS